MVEIELAAALLYVIFLALGSISIGYFLVRFAYPEVRVFSPEEKLGASALAGLLIAVLAIGADVVVNGVEAVLSGKGQPMWFWTAASGSLFVVLKLAVHEKHAELALPMTKKLETIQTEIVSIEQKPPESQSEITKKLNELRRKGLIPKSEDHDELVRTISPKTAPSKKPPYAQTGPKIPVIVQNVEEAKVVLEKAKETEIEAILSDLNIKFEKNIVPVQGSAVSQTGYNRHIRPQSVTQTDPLVQKPENHAEAAAPAMSPSSSAHPRRLYLQKQQPEVPHERGTHTRPAASVKSESSHKSGAEKPVTMEDLFGAAHPASTVNASAPVQLILSTQAPQHCPHCQAKNSRIVFCPYCGTGFCANCSPSITPTTEGFTYQCPKCGEPVPVKRRPATTG